MSFNPAWSSSTRQDHQTFMSGSQYPNTRTKSHESLSATTSPSGSQTQRSPPKLSSTRLVPPRNSASTLNSSVAVEIPFPNEAAAERHLRLSQKNEARITSVPSPTRKSLKDTSVNIASAFHQAATNPYIMSSKPLSASRSLNRGPSVDRLAAPPPPSSRIRSHHTEEEESAGSRFKRAVSPLMESAGEMAMAGIRAVSPGLAAAGSTLLSNAMGRQHSHVLREPRYGSFSSMGGSTKVSQQTMVADESYDYAAEEALANQLDGGTPKANGRKTSISHPKRKSLGKPLDVDNRAYKPPVEEYPSSSEDEHGKKRPKKTGPIQRHLLTGVPNMSTKRRPKRKSGSGATAVSEDGSTTAPKPNSRDSSSLNGGFSRQGSNQPREISLDEGEGEDEDFEQMDETQYFEDDGVDYDDDDVQIYQPSIGARLGKVANVALRGTMRAVGLSIISIWNILASIYDLLVTRPATFLSQATGNLAPLFNLKTFGALILIAAIWYSMGRTPSSSEPSISKPSRGKWSDWLTGTRRRPVYTVPDMPPGSIEDVIERLGGLEAAFAGLQEDHLVSVKEFRKGISDISADHTVRDALTARIMSLDAKLDGETRRAMVTEEGERAAAKKVMDQLRDAMASLNKEIALVKGRLAEQQQHQHHSSTPVHVPDPRTEERLSSMEKELADVTQHLQAAIAADNKRTAHVKHVSADGKDLAELVHNIVAKDGVGKPDFALYYSGGTVEPKMTSKSYNSRKGWGKSDLGRPPVTALVPDISEGNCWAFGGSQGQIGIRLNRIIHLTHITVDHPPRELLLDSTSAPRSFNIWIALDGQENVQRAESFSNELELLRLRGVAPDATTQPFGLWKMLHVGTFEYDIRAPSHTQTFEIDQKYQALKIDTGAVVVEFANNWGNPDFTCLYRVRVHGSQVIDQAAA